jgi:hypothetical protein
MPTITLSPAALALFRRRLSGERVEVADENRALYGELTDAGLMEPRHSFSRGNDGHYRLTETGARLRDAVLSGHASPAPSA